MTKLNLKKVSCGVITVMSSLLGHQANVTNFSILGPLQSNFLATPMADCLLKSGLKLKNWKFYWRNG